MPISVMTTTFKNIPPIRIQGPIHIRGPDEIEAQRVGT